MLIFWQIFLETQKLSYTRLLVEVFFYSIIWIGSNIWGSLRLIFGSWQSEQRKKQVQSHKYTWLSLMIKIITLNSIISMTFRKTGRISRAEEWDALTNSRVNTRRFIQANKIFDKDLQTIFYIMLKIILRQQKVLFW